MFTLVDGSPFTLYPAPFFHGRNYFVEDSKYITHLHYMPSITFVFLVNKLYI